jgi:NAD(P)-dependent dehydrogenase (short-subunit alcohol dehydrogenase family)
MPDVSKAVLITGCSTGIGRATAERLARHDWKVYATARRPESIADLESVGCRILALDVTDEGSMQPAVRAVEDAEGAVGVLINNAGYSQSGAVESVPMEDVRRQFETNVFGLVRMCQLVLPGMRRQGWGRIVNVSSTKHAVSALSDALRFEVKGFGVDVVIVEPGLIVTEFGDTAAAQVGEGAGGPYGEFNSAVAKATAGIYKGPAAKLGGGPDSVAKAIEKALSKPKIRVRVTPSAHLMLTQRRLMTDRMWDRLMRTQFPRPGA